MKLKRRVSWRRWQQPQRWLFLLLLIGNGLAWLQYSSRIEFPEYEPVLHPEIAIIRQNWQSGAAVGETFAVTVTDQMAMETMTWFLEPRPELPVSHPYVEIHADGVTGGAVLHLAGLQTPVLGQATIWLESGRVNGQVQSVSVAGAQAPGFVLAAVERGKQVYDNLVFPIEITRLELREGEVYIEGIYR